MKPICISCKLFYRPEKNGYSFIEGAPLDGDQWGPYKLWQGDLWECRGCGNQIIVSVGREPIAEHYEESFADKVAKYGATFRVDDC